MKSMLLKNHWKTVIQNLAPTHAVTLAYNPHFRGSQAAVFRVRSDGGRVQLPTRVDVFDRLTTARHVTPECIGQDVARFSRNVDRRLLGTRFNLKPVYHWSAYIGFIEHAESNVHVHLAWRCHDVKGRAGAELVKQWGKLSPHFTAHVEPLSDPVGWADYMLKNQSPADLLDLCGLILSRAH